MFFFNIKKNLQIFHTQQFSEEEKKVFRMYGKLPDRKDLLDHKLKVRELGHIIFCYSSSEKTKRKVCVYFLFCRSVNTLILEIMHFPKLVKSH